MIKSIENAIKIIEIINKSATALSVKDIADRTGMNKSTVHHALSTLKKYNFLRQNKYKEYDIGLRLVEIGQNHLHNLDLRKVAHPYLQELSNKIGETVNLMIMEDFNVIYIDKVVNPKNLGKLRCSSYVGMRTDVYSTASGKLILAYLNPEIIDEYLSEVKLEAKTDYTITDPDLFREHLKKIIKQDYALDIQEDQLGMQCIAVPIFNYNNDCIAAMSVSAPITRVSIEKMKSEFIPTAKEVAAKISSELAYSEGI
jgi:DNA-binding IclR family transcriptional regulator